MMKKTHEEFVKEVGELTNNEYVVLDKYEKAINKIKFKHTICGCEFEKTPNNFLRGQRCPDCSKKQKFKKLSKTHDQFKEEVFNLVGNEYQVIGSYVNSQTKITMKHTECGCEYPVTPNKFLQGRRCPNCFRNKKKTTEQYKQEIFNLVGDEYVVVGEYINYHSPVKMKHNSEECGCEWKVAPFNFIDNSTRCPECAGNIKKTTAQFKQEVYQAVGDRYSVLEEYNGANNKILMKHKECGKVYPVTPHKFSQGKRCPHCNESKGERKVADYLVLNGIKYVPQYKFNDCILKDKLRFDFAVFDDNNCLKLIIEYDGEQHFKPMRFSHDHDKNIEKFKQTQLRDKTKDNYCKENNIPLLRVPYWEFNNIESVLKRELLKYLY